MTKRARDRATRRQMLHMTGVGAASLLIGRSVAGCGDDADGGMGASMGRGDAGPSGAGDASMAGGGSSGRTGDAGAGDFAPSDFAPNEPWWLQGNYAPVDEELDVMDLEVEGALPPELDGLYLRNGSNARMGENGHWFIGDGMVHGVRISGGEALWYRNRWVQTPLLGREPRDGPAGPPALEDTASNVSVVHHAGKLLTLGEVGLPYQLSTEDLSTIGVYDFDGKLMTNMTAHPKIDPVTGELLMFGYNFVEPYLTYHQVDAQGVLQRSEPIDLPASPMMHDFAITENYVIFMDLPILFELDLAIAGDAFPFRWDDSHTARLGVMPRDGGNADIQWFEIEPCYVFHVMNAHEDPNADGVLVLEAARHERLWVDGPNALDGTPLLHRWRIDTVTGSVAMEQLDDRMVEFPQHDWRRTGRAYRYGYGLVLNPPMGDSLGGASAIMKMDHDTGATTTHELRASESTDEAIFVPAAADAGEDEGYLLSYVYDRAEDRTSVLVADASDMTRSPIARIHLPTRVPFGFHGFWVPAGG